MFSKSTNKKGNIPSPKSATSISILGDGCSFYGKVILRGEARIGGQIEGQIVSEGVLVIEESAHLKAEVRCTHIQVAGIIEGNVIAAGIVRLTPKAHVKGNITTSRLVVEEGATIQGKVDIEEESQNVVAEVSKLREVAS